MIRYLLALLLFPALCAGAITDRYVTDAGAGTGSGNDAANPMSLTTFTDYMLTAGSFNAAPGDRFNLKGPFTSRTTSSDSWVNNGNATSPIIIRGYGTTPGDGYQGRDSTGALVTTNMPTLTWSTGGITVGCGFFILETVQVNTGRGAYAINASGGSAVDFAISRCAVTNSGTSAGSGGVNLGARSFIFDSDITLSGATTVTAAGVQMITASSVCDSCRIKVTPATAPGIICASSAVAFANTIICAGGVGIDMNTASGCPFIRSNTIVGCGDGINIVTTTTGLQKAIGNMITDNSGYAIDMVIAGNAAFLANNRTRDNALGATNSGTDWVTATSLASYSHVTADSDSATEYTNFGLGNLQPTAASLATSVGVPPKASIGALQRDQTGATASTSYSATFAQ